MKVEATATPFTQDLKSIPIEEGLKHLTFTYFDGLGDLEENLNYFEQISNITTTMISQSVEFSHPHSKEGSRSGSTEFHPKVLILGKTSERTS